MELDAIHAKDTPVDERLCNEELRDGVTRALVRLPRRQATSVLMRYVLELPYREIGDALACSEATARVHVNRARQNLSRSLAHLASFHGTERKQ